MASPPNLDTLIAGVRAGNRALLAQAITLVESRRDADRASAEALIEALMPETGGAHRIGISGVPGVGKSTLIEALGCKLTAAGKRVGVLAVDPSSTVSGGSILGDKARMGRLAQDDNAFIRPSPTATTLGGVARRTRESMLVLEAANFDVILIETVGVGQSETVVAEMVDSFLVLLLPGGGDELQGIKKGILEHADLVAVNKADGERLPMARESARAVSSALRYARREQSAWSPRSLLVSAQTGDGLEELWSALEEHRSSLLESGEMQRRRVAQLEAWLDALCEERLLDLFRANSDVKAARASLLGEIAAGQKGTSVAADELLSRFLTPD
ncbi:MAG: LAO/AO transport system kinase [Planctomycetota bacterium]|jgi:LAO/AO transport system kinase